MNTVQPLGVRGVLPAFVVGHELEERELAAIEAPGFLLQVAQQAGGYCMSYPSVVGVVLRLEANLAHGLEDAARAVRGFAAMAEDPDLRLLEREFPSLLPLVYTRGDEYSKPQLATLQSFVGRYFRAPGVESGIEAFLRCAACDPLDYFRGWRALSIASQRTCIDGNYPDVATDESELFDENMLAALARVARTLGFETPPRVFFMWENSD